MSSTPYPIPVGPNNAALVTGFIDRCRQAGLDFCPSDPTGSAPCSLFLYHTPRTGSLRFLLPIRLTIETLTASQDNPLLAELLASTIAPFPTTSFHQDNQDAHTPEARGKSVFYSNRHLPYGIHKQLGATASAPPLTTATILRHPGQRLRSALKDLWQRHHQDAAASVEVIQQLHNHLNNPITRLFSGKTDPSQTLQDSDVEMAVNALCELDLCLHQENYSPVRKLQQHFISSNRLPNLIIPAFINRSAKEPDAETLTQLERAGAEAGCNLWDDRVYHLFTQRHPADLEPASFSINALHPLTFIMGVDAEAQQNQESLPRSLEVVRTLDLLLGKVMLPDHHTPVIRSLPT
jgi:hypothetical protein